MKRVRALSVGALVSVDGLAPSVTVLRDAESRPRMPARREQASSLFVLDSADRKT